MVPRLTYHVFSNITLNYARIGEQDGIRGMGNIGNIEIGIILSFSACSERVYCTSTFYYGAEISFQCTKCSNMLSMCCHCAITSFKSDWKLDLL